MLLLRCITFYSPYIQSLFNFSAFLIFPLQGRISLLFSLTFLPRAELRMRNGSAQDFSRHAAHEMKIVVIVVGSNNGALGSNKTTARREIQLRNKPKFCVGAATKLKPKSFARISPFHLRRRSRRWQRRSSSSTRREHTARERVHVGNTFVASNMLPSNKQRVAICFCAFIGQGFLRWSYDCCKGGVGGGGGGLIVLEIIYNLYITCCCLTLSNVGSGASCRQQLSLIAVDFPAPRGKRLLLFFLTATSTSTATATQLQRQQMRRLFYITWRMPLNLCCAAICARHLPFAYCLCNMHFSLSLTERMNV